MTRAITALTFAFLLAIAAFVQQTAVIALYRDPVVEMLTLGYTGDWSRCMYGYARGDTLHLRVLMPEGPTGCPTYGPDSIPAMGVMSPLPEAGARCEFSTAEMRSFRITGYAYRVRWCGIWEFRVWHHDYSTRAG